MSQQFTDDNFQEEVLNSDKPVLVDFYADWCGPCQMMSPIVDEVANELGDKVKVGKVNVDENSKYAEQYGVQGIPTFLIVKGGEVVEKFSGTASKDDLKAKLEAQL